MERVEHPIPPVADENSRILILGSFPSVRSREQRFFYGHPQNRFWKMIAGVSGETVPVSIDEKKALLLRHRIALWDVIASCEITGSSDASIRSVVPVDIARILAASRIERILCNGAAAGRLYQRHLLPITGIKAIILPSTSPANATWSLDRLTEAWKSALILEES